MKKRKLIVLDMKCYHGCNHYGKREKPINAGASSEEFPRCSEIEAQNHAVQHINTVSMRAEFILDLCEDLKRVKVLGLVDEELITLIEDMKKFVKESLEDFKTNQQVIRMNHLLRGFSTKAWKKQNLVETNTQITIE